MSHETMLAAINAELRNADVATMNLVLETLRQAKQAKPKSRARVSDSITPIKPQTQTVAEFIGENPPFDPHRNLSLHERGAFKRQLKAQNHEWLLKQFQKLKVAWLMVIDGRVTASGATLESYPKPEQILDVCQRTGKFPFLFVNEDHLCIEENGSWPKTIIPDDYYPTARIKLRSNNGAIELIGDFDTGASSTFVDYDWLVKHNLVQLQAQEDAESSHHLNQAYEYLPRSFVVEIASKSGEIRSHEMTISCVADWQKSPFTKINPGRTALLGRDIFLSFDPKCCWISQRYALKFKVQKPQRERKKNPAKANGALRRRANDVDL